MIYILLLEGFLFASPINRLSNCLNVKSILYFDEIWALSIKHLQRNFAYSTSTNSESRNFSIDLGTFVIYSRNDSTTRLS